MNLVTRITRRIYIDRIADDMERKYNVKSIPNDMFTDQSVLEQLNDVVRKTGYRREYTERN